jgi:phosphoglycerate dehydrogenase-like enzyme
MSTPLSPRPTSIFILWESSYTCIYSSEVIAEIERLTERIPKRLDPSNWREHVELLQEVDFIFSGWGMVVMDEAFLAAAPRLKYVFYGAGGVRDFYTEAAIQRSVRLSSAWRANAVPVSEFCHAAILFSLKKFWRIQRRVSASRIWNREIPVPGAFNRIVGLVSLGAIGRLVAQRLENHDLDIIAYDPFTPPEVFRDLGVEPVTLETLFETADVVSLHAPNLPSTKGMITGSLLRSMKQNATLINTARGQIINEAELIEVLQDREDLDALLDVTADEPDNQQSPLWDLPNVVLTPHIAGSLDQECQRMGHYMLAEFERYLTGQRLLHEVTPELLKTMA